MVSYLFAAVTTPGSINPISPVWIDAVTQFVAPPPVNWVDVFFLTRHARELLLLAATVSVIVRLRSIRAAREAD